jgi:hypothetical protein
MKTLLALLCLVVGLPGCGGREKPPHKPAPGPLVVFEHGGGIAAQPRRLEIDHQGRANLTVRTGADASSRTFRLSAAQLEDLEQALDAAAGADQPAPTGCADCFTYSIVADGLRVDLDQVSIDKAPDAVGRLVTLLEGLSSP